MEAISGAVESEHISLLQPPTLQSLTELGDGEVGEGGGLMGEGQTKMGGHGARMHWTGW